MSGDGENRFQRWSRRKAEARQHRRLRRGSAAPVPIADPATAPRDTVLPAAEETRPGPAAAPVAGSDQQPGQATPAATAGPPLPAIEDLDSASDYTGFLADGVPEALTRAALRKLWRSDPVLANLDGLNDYDDDFNLIDRLIQATDTRYRVGRGMLDEPAADEPDAEEAAPADDSVPASAEANAEPSEPPAEPPLADASVAADSDDDGAGEERSG